MSAKKIDERKYAKLVAKAWADEDFKARFIANPSDVLAEFDIDFPEGAELRVVEDSDMVEHLVLPKRPYSGSFAERSFDGGDRCHSCFSCFGCRGCHGGD